MNRNDWIPVGAELPPIGVVVETKVDDADGVRSECLLGLNGYGWYEYGGNWFAVAIPTHWRHVASRCPTCGCERKN